jgi:ribosomal subunit interface protein
MIQKLEISGVHTEIDRKLRDYVTRKIGKLDRFAPRKTRDALHAEVILKDTKAKDKKHCICEVVLFLPHDKIMVSESTMNMYAAVDIVEAKLKNLLKKYKETHSSLGLHKKMLARLRRRT